jgi:hypothetical protein
MFVTNDKNLKSKKNIVSMNIRGNKICSVNLDGLFISYEVKVKEKELEFIVEKSALD